ncbi:MAG: hypothetical protein P8Y48_13640 [Novosphingobium sp.]
MSYRNHAVLLAGAALASAISPALAEEAEDSSIIVTGSREANASINGLIIAPLRLPQNVRVLDHNLIDRTGITDLSQLFDLAGGMARQNSFGGAWDAYASRGFSGDINQGPDLLINRFTANRGRQLRQLANGLRRQRPGKRRTGCPHDRRLSGE